MSARAKSNVKLMKAVDSYNLTATAKITEIHKEEGIWPWKTDMSEYYVTHKGIK